MAEASQGFFWTHTRRLANEMKNDTNIEIVHKTDVKDLYHAVIPAFPNAVVVK